MIKLAYVALGQNPNRQSPTQHTNPQPGSVPPPLSEARCPPEAQLTLTSPTTGTTPDADATSENCEATRPAGRRRVGWPVPQAANTHRAEHGPGAALSPQSRSGDSSASTPHAAETTSRG